MTLKPLQKGCWPKEIVVCLECGEYDTAAVHLRNRRTCPSPNAIGAEHGPTQTVPVLPVELVEGLVGALEPVVAMADRLYAKGRIETNPGWDDDLTFPTDVELSVADLKRAMSALASYRQAMGEGQ